MAYQTADELRAAVPDLADETKFPDVRLEGFVASFEEIAEDYRGVAYEPRSATDTVLLHEWTTALRLSYRKVRAVTSVTVTDPAVGGSAAALSASSYTIDALAGVVEYPLGFAPGSKIVVVYTHGEDEPPGVLIEACWEYVRARAFQGRSGVPRDVISQNVEGMTTRFSTPDKDAGRPTGYLDVDRLLNSLPDFRVPF